MQQRVLIATALVCNPELLILDEPTTALDVTVEAQILDLLDRLRRQRQLGMIYITHNLGVVSRIGDRVCVLYAGQVFEIGDKSQILGRPVHPYTKGLLASLPHLSVTGRAARLSAIPGEFPDLTKPLQGCAFAMRCPFVEDRCRSERQEIVAGPDGRRLRCWKASALADTPWPGTKPGGTSRNAAERTQTAGELRAASLTKVYSVAAPGTGLEWARGWGGLPRVRWRRRPLRAVDDVSLTIGRGEVLGLVGESGSGKTTLGRMMVRLIEPTEGKLWFGSENVTALPAGHLQRFRKLIQLVFQNPDSSLNPRRSIGDAVARAVEIHSSLPAKARRTRVEALLGMVGLPRRYYDRYPHQLSGGEKQRAGIARALATEPAFIVCDEPVSALDVSVQATILNLLKDLRDELGIAYLFISHDLSVVAHVADRIAVMYAGRICEEGPAGAVLRPPHHPYTEALLSAVPFVEPAEGHQTRITLSSDPQAMQRPTQGCIFANRCHRKLGAICHEHAPPSRETPDGHRILCHIPLEDLAALPAFVPGATATAPRADSIA
jgi:peptide/nickel transport system ATP-binding protein